MAAARQVHLLNSCEDVGGEGGIRKVEEQTRLTSSAGRGGTAWLRALPNRSATRIDTEVEDAAVVKVEGAGVAAVNVFGTSAVQNAGRQASRQTRNQKWPATMPQRQAGSC